MSRKSYQETKSLLDCNRTARTSSPSLTTSSRAKEVTSSRRRRRPAYSRHCKQRIVSADTFSSSSLPRTFAWTALSRADTFSSCSLPSTFVWTAPSRAHRFERAEDDTSVTTVRQKGGIYKRVRVVELMRLLRERSGRTVSIGAIAKACDGAIAKACDGSTHVPVPSDG